MVSGKTGSKRAKKHVGFNDAKFQVEEFTPVAPEDKPNLWLSKKEINRNRQRAQDEVMFERTREVVKAKLVEECVLDQSHPEEFVREAQKLQLRLDQIMSGSKEEIATFLQGQTPTLSSCLLYDDENAAAHAPRKQPYHPFKNWILDCTLFWKDIPPDIREAAAQLGYRKRMWDKDDTPAEFDLAWEELSTVQKEAATTLGYSPETWDDPSLHTPSTSPPDIETGTPQIETEFPGTGNAATATNSTNKDMLTAGVEEVVNDKPMYESGATQNDAGVTPAIVSDYEWGAGSEEESSADYSAESEDSDESDKKLESKNLQDAGDIESGQAVDEFMSNFLSNDADNKEYLTRDPFEVDQPAEVEFISNFLSSGDQPSLSGSLPQRYVPSDDEFEFDEEAQEDVQPSADEGLLNLTPGSDVKHDEEEGVGESAPLLVPSGGTNARNQALSSDNRDEEKPSIDCRSRGLGIVSKAVVVVGMGMGLWVLVQRNLFSRL